MELRPWALAALLLVACALQGRAEQPSWGEEPAAAAAALKAAAAAAADAAALPFGRSVGRGAVLPTSALPRTAVGPLTAELVSGSSGDDGAGGSSRNAAAKGSMLAQETGKAAALTPWGAGLQHPTASATQMESRVVAEQAHADMRAWLQAYFQSDASRLTSSRLAAAREARAAAAARQRFTPPQPPAPELQGPFEVASLAGGDAASCNASCLRGWAEEALLRHERPGGRHVQLLWPPFREDARRWAAGGGANGTCRPRQPGEALDKHYLLIAPVGNNLSAVDRWLSLPASATFDVVLLHYGNDSALPCPHCAAVLRGAGPKWQLVWRLTQHPRWPELMAGRKAVMVADDDVVMDTAFEVFTAYGLLLGQPSLCPTQHRPSWYLHLVRNETCTLRFATMVEIMAPMFEARMFQAFARPSLWDAYTGWGADFVWPFLMHYPRDRIGVVDEVCMTHPHTAEGKTGGDSVYAALARVAPYDAREEEARRDAQYNYFPSEIRALGFAYRPDAVTGFVPNPDYVPPPPPAAPRRPPPPPPPLARLREIILTHAGMAAPPPPPPATQPSPRSKQGLLLQLQQRRQAQRPAAISTAAGATPPASQQGRSSARPRWLVYAQIALLLGAVAGLLRCARRRAQRALPSRRRLQFQPGLPLHANGNGKANGGKAPVSPLH